MKSSRVFAYLLGCIAFAAAILIHLEFVALLGFPDGFISELGYAQRRLARWFIGASFAAGFYFFYLGTIASRQTIGRRLSIAVALYLLLIAGILLLNHRYSLYLPSGAGG